MYTFVQSPLHECRAGRRAVGGEEILARGGGEPAEGPHGHVRLVGERRDEVRPRGLSSEIRTCWKANPVLPLAYSPPNKGQCRN